MLGAEHLISRGMKVLVSRVVVNYYNALLKLQKFLFFDQEMNVLCMNAGDTRQSSESKALQRRDY